MHGKEKKKRTWKLNDEELISKFSEWKKREPVLLSTVKFF